MERRAPNAGVVVLFGVAVVHASVVATSRFLPFVDLPQHVAAARLLWNLRRPEIARLYEADLVPQVNVLALLLGAPLHALLPEAAAVRVLVILGIVALAWALLQLARATGTSAWGAVAAMSLALHFGWMYGFVSFGLGIPILLFVLARLARAHTGNPSVGVMLGDAVLWWLLVLAHTLLAAFGLVSVVLWLLFSSGSRRAKLLRSAAVLPAVGWVIGWWASTRATLARLDPGSLGGGIEPFWHGPAVKLAAVGRSLVVASIDGRVEWMVLIAIGIVAAIAVVVERREGISRSGVRWVRLVALLAFAAYALLPYSIYPRDRVTVGLFILYPRFLVLAPLILLPTLAWPRQRLGRVLVGIVCAANVLLAWNNYRTFDRAALDAVGLDTAISSIPPRSIVKSLIYTPHPTGLRYEAFLHVASYYQARRLGETDQSFALLPTSPVHYRDPRHPYLSRHDEHLRPQEFDWERSQVYDYFLIYDRHGEWMSLYERTGRPAVFAHNGWLVLGPLEGR